MQHAEILSSIETLNAKGCINIQKICWTNLLSCSIRNHCAKSWRLGECKVSLREIMAAAQQEQEEKEEQEEQEREEMKEQEEEEEEEQKEHKQTLSLVALDLSWNEGIDESALCSLLQSSPLLTTLKLRACDSIGSATMLVAASCCPLLIKVNVARCNSVTNGAIVELAKNCLNLKDVNIAWSLCEDEGIVALLEYCFSLTHLSISGCKMITATGIRSHVIMHMSLQWLDASWVNAISENEARSFVADRKNISLSSSSSSSSSLSSKVELEVLDYYGESTSS